MGYLAPTAHAHVHVHTVTPVFVAIATAAARHRHRMCPRRTETMKHGVTQNNRSAEAPSNLPPPLNPCTLLCLCRFSVQCAWPSWLLLDLISLLLLLILALQIWGGVDHVGTGWVVGRV
eukprot:COSAG05_NODE_508_length_9135_cov_30.269780_12_plen_119_part_00